MMYFGAVNAHEYGSDDEMTGINASGCDASTSPNEQKQTIPDAPAFDPCSLSAPSTTGIIRDSNCIGTSMSDHAVTSQHAAKCARQGYGFDIDEVTRCDTAILDQPVGDASSSSQESKSPQLLVHVGTAGASKDAVGILRYDAPSIAKQYFINTLCNALHVDNTQFLIGPYDSIPTITRRALSAKQHTKIGIPAAGPADLAYLKAKMVDELRIDPVAVDILHMKHRELRDFFAAMIKYADDNARESHVRNINGLPMKARTPEEVSKNLTSAWGFDSERVLRDAGGEVKVADTVAISDKSIRVTPDDDRARHVRFGKWPTGEDIDQLPDLEECLRSPSRVSHDIFEDEPLWAREHAENLDRFKKGRSTRRLLYPVTEQECPMDREHPSFKAWKDWKSANSNVFRAEPAAPGTYPDFGGSFSDTVRLGIDSAARYYGARADDWKRQIMSPEFGAPNITLNDFAAQIGKALRVLPFPPKEVTLSMTLKA